MIAFREAFVVHNQSPRSMKGTLVGPEGETKIAAGRMYADVGETGTESTNASRMTAFGIPTVASRPDVHDRGVRGGLLVPPLQRSVGQLKRRKPLVSGSG